MYSLDQGGGCLFSASSLGASPVGLNNYSSMLPSVLLTAVADVTIDFLTDVTCDTVRRLKRHLAIPCTGILIYDNIHHATLQLSVHVPKAAAWLLLCDLLVQVFRESMRAPARL
jgi:hypothetical protein